MLSTILHSIKVLNFMVMKTNQITHFTFLISFFFLLNILPVQAVVTTPTPSEISVVAHPGAVDSKSSKHRRVKAKKNKKRERIKRHNERVKKRRLKQQNRKAQKKDSKKRKSIVLTIFGILLLSFLIIIIIFSMTFPDLSGLSSFSINTDWF